MKNLKALALGLLLTLGAPLAAFGQCSGQAPALTYCGNPTGSQALPGWKPMGGFAVDLDVGSTTITGGTSKGILFNNSGFLGNTAAGTTGWLLANAGTNPAFMGNIILVPAICDNATDNTAIFASAISSAPSAGAYWIAPPGICRGELVINKPGIFTGSGMSAQLASAGATEIRGTSTSNPVISITSSTGGVTLQNLGVTSTVAAGSRTGPGVKVNAGSNILIDRVFTNGHRDGFLNESAGVRYEDAVAYSPARDCFRLDGSVGAQNQIIFGDTRADTCGAVGVNVIGPATGLYFNHLIVASATSHCVTLSQPGVAGTRVADAIFTAIEISSCGGSGLNNSLNPDGTGIIINGGLIEGANGANGQVWFGTTTAGNSATGIVQGVNFRDNTTIAVFANGSGVTIANNTCTNNIGVCVEAGPTSANLNISNNQVENLGGGTTGFGLVIDGGAGALVATGNNFTQATTPLSGTVPAGSVFKSNRAIADTTGNLAAPGSPAAGNVASWFDSTDLRFHDKNSAGTIGTTVVADTGAANNFLTAISAAGIVSKAQPTISNLANVAANTMLGNWTGGSAAVLANAMPSCPDTDTNRLNYLSGTGIVCGTGTNGTVTSVGFTGGLISVANPTTTPAFTVAGTSGGIPYFSSTSTWASSALLGANLLMQGGGAGAAPSTFTLGGDCTFATPNITCTKVNGVTYPSSMTSGGILYASSTSAVASSALLAANALVIGGGAGVAPSTTTTGSGILTWIGAPSSANLASALTDETGTGLAVFGTSPQFTTKIGINAASPGNPLYVAQTSDDSAALGYGVQIKRADNDSTFTFGYRSGAINAWEFRASYTTTGAYAPINFYTSDLLRMQVQTAGGVNIGATQATLTAGELGMNKISASGSAPGAGTAKLAIVAGTSGGTCKLIMYAGTSTTPTTVVDNVGTGC